MTPDHPHRDVWTSQQIADYLKCSPRHAIERYACLPDFPRAIRLPSAGGRSRPRWYADEVIAWVEKYQVAA